MDHLFTGLALMDVHDDLARNIVGFIESQHVFDDLSGSEDDWHMAEQVELEMKLPGFDSLLPIIDRPFVRVLGLLSDAGFNKAGVIAERRVFWVRCDAALINLKEKVLAFPELLNRDDYRYCQEVGARIHHEGHPGLITRSARYLRGDTIAILNSKVLSSPRHAAYFSYTLQDDCIDVQEDGKSAFLTIPI